MTDNPIRDLIALRAKHGADSAVGHRCSNVIEMMQNLRVETDRETRVRLKANIEKQMAELSALCRGDQ